MPIDKQRIERKMEKFSEAFDHAISLVPAEEMANDYGKKVFTEAAQAFALDEVIQSEMELTQQAFQQDIDRERLGMQQIRYS